MDTHYVCPVCKKDNCFVCTYWNDDNLMDRLFAENGSLCFDHFDSIWLELLTHFFVRYGKTETTMEELYRTFGRNGFLPKGMESTLHEMEGGRKITIKRKQNSNSWYSSILALFVHEKAPENTIIRCDYLLQEATRCISDIASGCEVNLFLLPCKESLLSYIHSNKEQLKDIDSSFYTIAEASQKVIEYEICHPLDLKAQAKQFLRNLQNGEDEKFAKFCCNHGIGSIFRIPGFSVFIINHFNECTLHLSKLPLLFRISNREKEYTILDEEFNTKSRELAKEYKNDKQSSIRERYKILKQTFNRKRKRISNEIALLHKQLGIIQDAITAKTKYSKAVLKKMNLSLDNSVVDTYKEELDGTIEEIDDSVVNRELDELVANDSPVPATGVSADSITFD